MSDEPSPLHRVSLDGGAEHRDVTDVVEEEWVEKTTPSERVYDPLSVAQIRSVPTSHQPRRESTC